MRLTPEQLTTVFHHYLIDYVLPRSFNHLPLFEDYSGGLVLTKRLLKILRDPKVSYVYRDGKIDCEELIRIAKEHLENQDTYIIGLNYWFSKYDLEVLREIYVKLFLD